MIILYIIYTMDFLLKFFIYIAFTVFIVFLIALFFLAISAVFFGAMAVLALLGIAVYFIVRKLMKQ
jgi:hypothetical protein